MYEFNIMRHSDSAPSFRSQAANAVLLQVRSVATSDRHYAGVQASQSGHGLGSSALAIATAGVQASQSGHGLGSSATAIATAGVQASQSGHGLGSSALISAETADFTMPVFPTAEIARNCAANTDVNNTRLIMLGTPLRGK